MAVTEPARKASEPAKAKKREFKNTPLNDTEKERLHRLAIRFQNIVEFKNKSIPDINKQIRVMVEDVDLIRAGLLRLEAIEKKNDNEFYEWVVRGRNRE